MDSTIRVETYSHGQGHVGVYSNGEQDGGAFIDTRGTVRLDINGRTYIIDTEDGSIHEETYTLTDKGQQAISR